MSLYEGMVQFSEFSFIQFVLLRAENELRIVLNKNSNTGSIKLSITSCTYSSILAFPKGALLISSSSSYYIFSRYFYRLFECPKILRIARFV